MTTIPINGGTMHTDKRLVQMPEPVEYPINGLRRILLECEHDADPELTAQLDAVDELVNSVNIDTATALAYGDCDLGTYTIIDGGEVLELGKQIGSDKIPF